MKTIRLSLIAVMMLAGGLVLAQERFDDLVRGNFFAGFAGNKEALDRGMKTTEEILAKDPNHAEAKVWHGSGVLYKAGEAFQKGDFQTGTSLWQQSLNEMEQAVQLAPTNIAVLIPRGATFITASRSTPAEVGRPILETGVSDFEKVLKLQEAYFSRLSTHSRGEFSTAIRFGRCAARVAANGNGRLVLNVWDSGPGFAQDAIVPGHGLHDLRSRLAALWGRRARLEVLRENSGTNVALTFPATLHE